MIQPLEKKIINQNSVYELIMSDSASILAEFYEMQSSFLVGLYKRYKSFETSNIILCLASIVHLEIIRIREKSMGHDISLKNFNINYSSINRPSLKLVSIIKMTGIPKETVRRKIKALVNMNHVGFDKNKKEYFWNLHPKHEDSYYNIIDQEIDCLSKFSSFCANGMGLEIEKKEISKEIKSQFSFYWYHFLSYQLKWLKMWQDKIKDIDLILITLQAIIPTLQFSDKNQKLKDIGMENFFTIIGKTNDKYQNSNTTINASSISEVTGIPRATCIRKLETLVKMGMLVKETKSKRYYINQQTSNRTKKIITKENVDFTVTNFSEYLTIVLNAVKQKK